MKRLAVLVKHEKVDAVVTALRELDLEAVIYDVKGAGKEKEQTYSGRGASVTSTQLPRRIIATVVGDDKVQATSDAIKNSISDSKGVIIVTSVDDFIPF